MRFAQTLVSSRGYGEPDHNERRFTLLGQLLIRLATERVSFAALPAGYLTVRTDAVLRPMVARIGSLVERTGVGILVGIDVGGGGKDRKGGKGAADVDALTDAGALPFFGFALRPGDDPATVPLWRQSHTTGTNSGNAPQSALPHADRLVRFGNRAVYTLLCGEIYGDSVRGLVPQHRPRLVVDLGHQNMSRVTGSMLLLAAQADCAVTLSQHTDGGQFHFITAGGEKQSEWQADDSVADDLCEIRWRVREV